MKIFSVIDFCSLCKKTESSCRLRKHHKFFLNYWVWFCFFLITIFLLYIFFSPNKRFFSKPLLFLNSLYSRSFSSCFVGKKALLDQENASVPLLKNMKAVEFIPGDTVNVKQFGAYGDGIHDDTKAIQCAIDSDASVVVFPRATYKCGEINVSKNKRIDCQNSTFIATAKKLFNISGKVTKTIVKAKTYTANQKDFYLEDGYSGYGKLVGKNNFEPKKASYRSGMVTWFQNGLLKDKIPIDVETPSVLEVKPITCEIKNIDGVSFIDTTDGTVVFIQYGIKCLIKDIRIRTGVFSIAHLKDCYQCEITGIDANMPEYKGDRTNIYPVLIDTSCYTYVHNCHIDNPFWHCLSTGGILGICLNTLIRDCTFTSKTQISICDHANCIGTKIEKCKCSGIGVGSASQVRDCVILPRSDKRKMCVILLFATSLKDLAQYNVENIVFKPAIDSTISGIYLTGFSRTSNYVGYISDVFLKNIKAGTIPDNKQDMIGFLGFQKFAFAKLGNVVVDDCNLHCFLTEGERNNFDTSDFIVTYKNCKTIRPDGDHIKVALPTGGKVRIKDSYIDNITESGIPENLTLDNVVFYNATKIEASNCFFGRNILAKQGLNLYNTNNVLLDNVKIGSQLYEKIWRNNSEQACYGKRAGDDEIIIISNVSF